MGDADNNRQIGADTRITRQLAFFAIACVCLIALAAILSIAAVNSGQASEIRDEIVALNAAVQNADSQNAADAISQAQDVLRETAHAQDSIAVFCVLAIAILGATCVMGLAVYLHTSVVSPFTRLQGFAESVAAGNLDLPLEYERSNPFGKFAWAFDHMRNELKRARAAERAAIEGNKCAMASLAHDLRTPVASIRAYSEALEIGLDTSPEERREYAQVIERRSDEVSQLVDDMLTHSLAELDRISVECAPVPAVPLIENAAKGFGIADVVITTADEAIIVCDAMRTSQAIENLLANASKYAPGSKVEVSGMSCGEGYRITVRDFGPGMNAQDIPFAFDRFFRGANSTDSLGAGLGLYVVKYVVERMSGRVRLQNAHPGLLVSIELPLA